MYLTKTDAIENISEYDTIKVDDKTFYCKKEVPTDIRNTKKRYSDQFKDPLFKIKDNYRKLHMLKQFFDKNNLEELTEKYRGAIVDCTEILHKEFNVELSVIYRHFNLEKYGFDPGDFGINDEEDNYKEELFD